MTLMADPTPAETLRWVADRLISSLGDDDPAFVIAAKFLEMWADDPELIDVMRWQPAPSAK